MGPFEEFVHVASEDLRFLRLVDACTEDADGLAQVVRDAGELLARGEHVLDMGELGLAILRLSDGHVVELEAVELAGGVTDLKVAEEDLEVVEPSCPLINEVEERFTPQLHAIDY